MKITIEGNTVDGSARSTLNVVLSGARGPAGEPSPLGVPYTGATQDVNLGEFGLLTGNVEFDTTPTNAPTGAGSMSWNDTDGTVNLVLKGGNVVSKIGETQHIRAYNNTGTAIARGKVVYVSGAQGQRLTIALADADTEILSKDTIGFTAESIADGAEGFVIIAGVLSSMNTSGMSDGATVYLSQTLGGYTTTPPVDPAHLVILGFIVNGGSGGAGSIYVKVDNGYELEELHGVADAAKVTPVAADALLLRDSADNNLWKRLTWTNALAGVKTHMDTFKGVAGGYASLDGGGKIPSTELPSYVDDVIEAASFAALPVTGETGKIYVTLDTNKVYRWTGSVYVEVSAGGASAWGAITGTLSNQTDLQSALDGKVDENLAIVGATKTKITYDAKGLVTAGADAAIADISGLQTALDGKQGTLSLTTTGTSGAATLVGSTLNIPQYQSVLTNPVTASPISDASQIAFFNGGNSITGSSNLFWSNANIRLGIGTNTPTGRIHALYSNFSDVVVFERTPSFINDLAGSAILRAGYSSDPLDGGGPSFAFQLRSGATITDIASFGSRRDGANNSGALSFATFASGVQVERMRIRSGGNVLINNTDGTGRLTVRGSGTTSATTAVLVQNSTPSELFKVADNGNANFGTGMYYDAVNQRVGIGTNAPSNDLHLESANAFIRLVRPANEAGITATTSSSNTTGFTIRALSDRLGLRIVAPNDANNEWIRIFGLTKNVSIGLNTDASARLTVRGSGTTSATNGLLIEDSTGSDNFTIRDDGGYAFRNGTVGLAQTGYTTFTNLTTDRTCDANATTVEELADILGTLIEDLKTKGIISA